MSATSRRLRILIVDDCEDTAASYGELLQLYGHECRAAQSGDKALPLLDGWEPDAALLDIHMPGPNGYELARLLCARVSGKPLLVAVTGVFGEAARLKAREAGFDHYLVKPVNSDVLVDLLRTHAATLGTDSRE